MKVFSSVGHFFATVAHGLANAAHAVAEAAPKVGAAAAQSEVAVETVTGVFAPAVVPIERLAYRLLGNAVAVVNDAHAAVDAKGSNLPLDEQTANELKALGPQLEALLAAFGINKPANVPVTAPVAVPVVTTLPPNTLAHGSVADVSNPDHIIDPVHDGTAPLPSVYYYYQVQAGANNPNPGIIANSSPFSIIAAMKQVESQETAQGNTIVAEYKVDTVAQTTTKM